MTSWHRRWLSLDVWPVDGVVDGRVDPVERHEEVERPVPGTEHTSNVVGNIVEVGYLDETTPHVRHTLWPSEARPLYFTAVIYFFNFAA